MLTRTESSTGHSTTIQATCRRCRSFVLAGINSWIKVTRTYYLPAEAGSYKTALRATEQPRPAFNGTDLSECQIQPLSCSICHETLGILCTDTPTSKSRFRLRELFKLSRIILKDRTTGVEVEPRLEQAMLEEHRQDAHHVGKNVDDESRPNGSPAVGLGSRDSLLPPPSTEPVQRNASPIQLPSLSQQHPPQDEVISHLQSSLQSQLHVHSQILEEQRQELDNQRHHFARIDNAIEAISYEQRNIFNMIDDLRIEVSRSRASASERPDNSEELDILAKEVQSIASKANEVEGIKMQMNLLRSQMRRMERHGSPVVGSAATSLESKGHEHTPQVHAQPPAAPFVSSTPLAQEPRPVLYQTPTEARLPAPVVVNNAESHPMTDPGEPRMLPGFRSIDPTSSSAISQWRPAGGFAPQPPAPPAPAVVATTPQIEAPAAGSGWAAVNTNSAPKRAVPPEAGPPYDSSLPGSPKRQRLAPLMPRTSYDQHNPASSPYQPGSATDTLPTVPSLIASRNPSNESSGSVPPPSNALRFVQFASGSDASPDEAWRQDIPRTVGPSSERGRGSPRRGRGGRGRGGRKSTGADGDRGTPEWDHPEYNQSACHSEGRGGIVRRGGHAGSPSDRPIETPQAGMYPDPHFMPITTTADVASSSMPAKKTRTKPVRNSEGILIRKDGRPDMRSVSSAMNLKKVHAKKEAERAGSAKDTPEDGKERSSAGAAHTPRSVSEHDVETDDSLSTPSAHERSFVEPETTNDRRHQENMRKIFPFGVESGTPSVVQQFFPKPDDTRAPEAVKIEAVGEARERAREEEPHEKHPGMKPLVDGERSMVHHVEGRVDVEMGDAD